MVTEQQILLAAENAFNKLKIRNWAVSKDLSRIDFQTPGHIDFKRVRLTDITSKYALKTQLLQRIYNAIAKSEADLKARNDKRNKETHNVD